MRIPRLAARWAVGAVCTAVTASGLPAQERGPARDTSRSDRSAVIYRSDGSEPMRFLDGMLRSDDANRAALGVSTGSGGERDTLGLLVTSITANGPADRAGLEEGNRIAAINGVNLRLAPADAGEPDMRGLTSRRLTRELTKVRPGDNVELRVWQNGQFRTVRVRTVAADSLPGRRSITIGGTRAERDRQRAERQRERDDRPVLGLELQSSGNRRDTLGVLVTRVAENGPAERAGMIEGDRVAAVNGVDLRVSREDAGDSWVTNAKSNRFSRELSRLRPGQSVELRVWSAGQFKTVRVTAGRAGDVYKEGQQSMLFRSAGFDGDELAPLPPIPPTPPTPPAPPTPIGEFEWTFPRFELNGAEISRRVDEAMQRAGEAVRRADERLWRNLDQGRAPRGVYRM